jgi:hypothetical protein
VLTIYACVPRLHKLIRSQWIEQEPLIPPHPPADLRVLLTLRRICLPLVLGSNPDELIDVVSCHLKGMQLTRPNGNAHVERDSPWHKGPGEIDICKLRYVLFDHQPYTNLEQQFIWDTAKENLRADVLWSKHSKPEESAFI